MSRALELLLVDDNPADVGLALEALASCEHCGPIRSVNDGEEAMAFLKRKEKYANALRPALVLLDLNLPKKDGLAVLAAVKADPDLRRIPVVIFSTSQASEDIARSYELGANCYISKPGNLNDFFAAMKSLEQFWFGVARLPAGEE